MTLLLLEPDQQPENVASLAAVSADLDVDFDAFVAVAGAAGPEPADFRHSDPEKFAYSGPKN